jgi:hypothetical protein
MSIHPALPPLLRVRLAAVARRVRLLRLARGLSLLALTLALAGGAALLADFFLDLPGVARQAALSAWVGLGTACLLLGLALPLCRRLDPADLAAVIEEKYPELGERLTSTVGLAGRRDGGHGSPALITLLVQDTEQRSRRLNFLPAISSRSARLCASFAAAAVVLAVAPAVAWPQQYVTLGKRFLMPWRAAPVVVPYALEVSPGDAYAARGRSVTFTVRLKPDHDGVDLPTASTLVLTDETGNETRHRMAADSRTAFSLTHKVTADVSYRVEAGNAVSDTFGLTAVMPVELANESPEVRVTPPEYARNVRSTETRHGLADLTALRHSEVGFDFRFSRPAVAATLEWSTTRLKAGKDASSHTLTLTPDRLGASFTLPAGANGSYRLVLEAEHGIRTELRGGDLAVIEDQPPKFLRFSGKDELKAVLPYDKLPLEVHLGDDIGVAAAYLEYKVNGGEAAREPIVLQGAGTQDASGKHLFLLADKVQEGDEIQYRIRAEDNLPTEFGGPHVIYHPADRWLRLKVVRQAEPLQQQEILAQRDDVGRRLEAIKADLMKEQRGVYKVRQESRNEPALTPEQARDLKDLRQDNENTTKALDDLARETGLNPALQSVTERAKDVAEREMRRSQAALDQAAEKKRPPNERNAQLQNADKQLTSALRKLDELKKANDKLAQDRLDQAKVEMLADREKQLAEKAAELTEKDLVRDPAAREQAEQIKREQAEVAAELQRLTEQSEALRSALDEARAEQTRQAAERARELAQAERDLARASAETDRKRNTERLGELARKQQELAEQEARLAQETQRPAQTAKTPPLKSEAAQKAADALKQGEANEALKQQGQAARDLERLATDLDKAIDLARDPREAARQLARLEEGLKQRVQEEVRKRDPEPLGERLQALQKEQAAVQEAVERLSVPPRGKEAQKAREDAAAQSAKAAEALEKSDSREALARMEQARQALERLADNLPTLEQRQQQALRELARLRQQQDEISRQMEQAEQQAKKEANPARAREQLAQKMADAARRQAEVAEAVSKMDAPKQEARQERTQDAVNRALADLMDARTQDVAPSQQGAKRELERLEQALAGRKPAEELPEKTTSAKPAEQSAQESARQVAKEQRELARATEQAQQAANKQPGEAGKQALQQALEKLAQQQRDLNQQASQLPANQAQKGLEQARAAMNQAQQALERKDAAQAQQKQTEAANALDRLAQQLPAKAPTAPRNPEGAQANPQGLPNKEQSDRARQLAREQRDLQDSVRRAAEAARADNAPGQPNPAGDLAKQQAELAKEAAELARDVGREQGEQSEVAQKAQRAQQSARQAANQMQAGALPAAQQSGKQATEGLRQLAQQIAQTPRGQTDPQAPDTLQQARQLAQRQEELNRKLESVAGNPEAQRVQQQARQQDLQKQTQDLAQGLNRMAQQMSRSPQAQQSAQQAANSAQQAQAAMQQARDQGRQGNQGQAQQSAQQAAQALERAGQQAGQSAAQQTAGKAGSPQAGQALQQAQGQMGQAQGQLNQGQPRSAQTAMEKAAQALQQAAQQMAQGPASGPSSQPPTQPGRPGETSPGEFGAAPGGAPDPNLFPADLKKYAGRPWGELPGELRTRIVQDLQAKYGEDYARMIKLYFEQIASGYHQADRSPPAASAPPGR